MQWFKIHMKNQKNVYGNIENDEMKTHKNRINEILSSINRILWRIPPHSKTWLRTTFVTSLLIIKIQWNIEMIFTHTKYWYVIKSSQLYESVWCMVLFVRHGCAIFGLLLANLWWNQFHAKLHVIHYFKHVYKNKKHTAVAIERERI